MSPSDSSGLVARTVHVRYLSESLLTTDTESRMNIYTIDTYKGTATVIGVASIDYGPIYGLCSMSSCVIAYIDYRRSVRRCLMRHTDLTLIALYILHVHTIRT